jgi:sulfur-oxidizing protein SoxZ
MATAIVKVPARARAGEVIELSAMIAHPMETGFRTGDDGAVVPRNIVRTFVCSYDGAEVFRADLFPSVTANPYVVFTTVATRSGALSFRWIDDTGAVVIETASIVVE